MTIEYKSIKEIKAEMLESIIKGLTFKQLTYIPSTGYEVETIPLTITFENMQQTLEKYKNIVVEQQNRLTAVINIAKSENNCFRKFSISLNSNGNHLVFNSFIKETERLQQRAQIIQQTIEHNVELLKNISSEINKNKDFIKDGKVVIKGQQIKTAKGDDLSNVIFENCKFAALEQVSLENSSLYECELPAKISESNLKATKFYKPVNKQIIIENCDLALSLPPRTPPISFERFNQLLNQNLSYDNDSIFTVNEAQYNIDKLAEKCDRFYYMSLNSQPKLYRIEDLNHWLESYRDYLGCNANVITLKKDAIGKHTKLDNIKTAIKQINIELQDWANNADNNQQYKQEKLAALKQQTLDKQAEAQAIIAEFQQQLASAEILSFKNYYAQMINLNLEGYLLDLTSANLQSEQYNCGNFSECDLRGVKFHNNMLGMIFENSLITDCSFSNKLQNIWNKIVENISFIAKPDFIYSNISLCHFNNCDISSDLNYTKFIGNKLNNTHINNSSWQQVELSFNEIKNSTIESSIFDNCQLLANIIEDSDFLHNKLHNVVKIANQFNNTNFIENEFKNVKQILNEFYGSKYEFCNFENYQNICNIFKDTQTKENNYKSGTITGDQLIKFASYKDQFEDCIMNFEKLEQVKFIESNIKNLKLKSQQTSQTIFNKLEAENLVLEELNIKDYIVFLPKFDENGKVISQCDIKASGDLDYNKIVTTKAILEHLKLSKLVHEQNYLDNQIKSLEHKNAILLKQAEQTSLGSLAFIYPAVNWYYPACEQSRKQLLYYLRLLTAIRKEHLIGVVIATVAGKLLSHLLAASIADFCLKKFVNFRLYRYYFRSVITSFITIATILALNIVSVLIVEMLKGTLLIDEHQQQINNINGKITTNNNIINSIETKQDTIKDDIAKQTTDMLKLTDQEKEQIVNLELLTSLKDGVDEGLKNALAIRLQNPQVTKEASYISKIKKNITEAKGLSPKPAMKAAEGQINKNFVANFV